MQKVILYFKPKRLKFCPPWWWRSTDETCSREYRM